MGVRRTFETTAELRAFVTGYSDGINTARTVLVGAAAVVMAHGQRAAAESIKGIADTLGEHIAKFVAEHEGKTV